jgi:sn-glycerol 3-phosphate transport system substrate-binding protein
MGFFKNFARLTAFVAGASLSYSAYAATEIQWWHAMGGVLGERVNKMANDFNATQSDYKVVPVYKGNYTETMTAAIAAFRAKKQPHIVQVFEVGTATMMAAKGAVYPVEDLMKDSGLAFDKSIYLPAVISYYQRPNGDLLSLPFNSSTPVLWYNRDAFKKAGLDPDNPPNTWDGIASASKKLLASGMKCGFSFGWQSWVMVENFSAWHNLPIGTMANGFEGLATEFTFNNDKVAGMLQQIADWRKDKIFEYAGRRGESLPKFTNGECGMWMNSSAYYGSMKKQAKFDFAQTMLPLNTGIAKQPQNSIIGGATLWVLKGHDKGDYKGVGQFMKYLSSPGVQSWWHQQTGYVPITTPAYELSKKEGFYTKNPGTDTAIKQLSLNKPTPNSMGLRFGNFVQIRDIINEEMEAIWAGKKTAKQGLDDAAKRGNVLLRKFERANKGS